MEEQDWATVGHLVDEACIELWRSLGASTQPSGEDPLGTMDHAIVAAIGFGGDDLRGSVTLAATREFVRATHPATVRGETPSEADLLDWCSELANQLLGRLKNKLLSYGVMLFLSTPSAVVGADVRLHPQSGVPGGSLRAYRVDERSIVVSWTGEANRPLSLGAPRPRQDDVQESVMLEF